MVNSRSAPQSANGSQIAKTYGPSRTQRRKPRRQRPLQIEALEDRRLLDGRTLASYLADRPVLRDEIIPGGFIERTSYFPSAGESIPTGGGLDGLLLSALGSPIVENRTGTFDIVLQKTTDLAGNTAASAAFDRAAQFWEGQFTDPITVYIDAHIGTSNIFGEAFGPHTLGSSASATTLQAYSDARGAMIRDASVDEGIVGFMPSAGQIAFDLPASGTVTLTDVVDGARDTPFNPLLSLNRANALALGFTDIPGLDSHVSGGQEVDGYISFNSNFSFDFDNSDGVSAGRMDFEAIALHEIGHALGFSSSVDEVDYYLFFEPNPPEPIVVLPSPMDMFRLAPGQGGNFSTAERIMDTGVSTQVLHDGAFDVSAFSGVPGVSGLTTGDIPMSTGEYMGDGEQASHFKADETTGVLIGLMDPTLASATTGIVTATDLRVMGLIGWDWKDNSSSLTGDVPTATVHALNTADTTPPLTGTVSETGTDVYVRVAGFHGNDEAVMTADGELGGVWFPGAMTLANSASSNASIVRMDLILPSYSYDYCVATGWGGDFVALTGETAVGLQSPESDTNFSDSDVLDFTKLLTLEFNDFDPGETFGWTIWILNEQANNAYGDELIGACVCVEFDNGITVSNALSAVAGNSGASRAILTAPHYLKADVSGTNWTIPDNTLSSLPGGTYDVEVLAVDSSGAQATDTTNDELVVDPTGPWVVITDDEPGVANIAGGNVTFTFTFNEPVTGFETDDVTVTGGTKGAFTPVSDTVYTLDVTPTANSTANIMVDVAAGAVMDATGNPNTPASAIQQVDTLRPSLSITDDEPGVANIAHGNVTFTFTFSDPVTGFDVGDITVSGGTKGTFEPASGSMYTLEVVPNEDSTANITVDVSAGAATDVNSNPNTAASAFQTVDTLPPSLTIMDDEPGIANIARGNVTFTFTFSEPVTGFEAADITVAGGTKGGFWMITETEYSLDVTPDANSTANITVNVAAGTSTDAHSNPNTAASAVQPVDTAPPLLMITDDEPGTVNIGGGNVTFTFTFSESVTGFDTGDIAVTGGTKGEFVAVSGTMYTLVVTPNPNSTADITVDVAAGVATDANSNPNPAAFAVQPVDTSDLELTISDDESGVANIAGGNVTFTFTFSEPVTGFETGDITVAGGTKGAFSETSASVYTLIVTPNANSTANITVGVSAGAATDANSNPNTAASAVQMVDTLPPSLTIMDDEPGVANIAGGSVIFTFTFSETVTGFDAGDIAVTGGAKGAFTEESGAVYTLVVTPNVNSTANITAGVAAGVATDANGNPNTAEMAVQPVDTLAPVVTVNTLTTGDTTPEIGGTVSEGTLQVVLDGITYIAGDGNLSISGTTWTLQVPAENVMVPGTYDVAAVATDTAGNTGADGTTDDLVVSEAVAVSLTRYPNAVLEDGTDDLEFVFQRSAGETGILTVNFSVAGLATWDSDYTVIGAATFSTTAGSVVFPAGSSMVTVIVSPVADANVEADETVVLTLNPGAGYELGAAATASGTIKSEDIGLPAGWAQRYVDGDSSDDRAQDVAVDAAGNIYVTGVLQLTTANFFVAKYAPDGALLWHHNIGGTGDDRSSAIAVDSLGNVLVTGYFHGTVDFDPSGDEHTLTAAGAGGVRDIFVMKLDTQGNFVWAQRFGQGGGGWDQGYSIAAGPDGQVVVGGLFSATVDFDPSPEGSHLVTAGGQSDAFVLSLGADGSFGWVAAAGGSDYGATNGVAVDVEGNVYATGGFCGQVAFDPNQPDNKLTADGAGDVFIWKLTGQGAHVVAGDVGDSSADAHNYFATGADLALDHEGFVYVTGRFQGQTDFDPSPSGIVVKTSYNDGFDAFLLKLDTSLAYQWAVTLGNWTQEEGWDVAVDAYGNVVLGGAFQATMDFDPAPSSSYSLTSTYQADIKDAFLLSLSPFGDFRWVRGFNGSGDDRNGGLAVSPSGIVAAAGYFSDTAGFIHGAGTTILTSAGGNDGYVVSFVPVAAPSPYLVQLHPASDSGILNDRITGSDNHDAANRLDFVVYGTVTGALVELFEGTQSLGSTVATGSPTTVRTNGTFDLSDGQHQITARQTEPGKPASASSSAIVVTVDTAGPTVAAVTVNDLLVTEADVGAAHLMVTVDFGEAMDPALAPALTFAPAVATTLTWNAAQSGWTDADTYVAKYDVMNANVKVDDVTIDVFGANDLAGNDQQDYTPEIEFDIDTLDIVEAPEITVEDNSGVVDDGAIQFSTRLSLYRTGISDSPLVRPAFPDNGHYVDVTNSGQSPLQLYETQINVANVSLDIVLTSDPADDIVLAPGQTQRFRLTYAPTAPALAGTAGENFLVDYGVVILSNAPQKAVALRGASTYNSDISYDGQVNLSELGVLNANFGKTSGGANFDPTADITGDGKVNLSDLGPLNAQYGKRLPVALMAVSSDSTAVAESTETVRIEVNLYQDNGGVPGAALAGNRIEVGQSFFAEIVAADVRDPAAGIISMALDIDWDPAVLTEIDSPFNPASTSSALVTAKFPLFRSGTLNGATGFIDELSGGSFPAASLGEAIGVGVLERFSLLHFQAMATSAGTAFTVQLGSSGQSLADGEMEFPVSIEAQTIVVDMDPYDVRMVSAKASGAAGVDVTYDIVGNSAGAFEIGFVRSGDTKFDASDAVLDRVLIDAAADRTVGRHTKTFPIGGAGVALPGAGEVETNSEYFLLAVGDPRNLVDETAYASDGETNNTVAMTGVYHVAGGPVMVHGAGTADVIKVLPQTALGHVQVDYRGTVYEYPTSDVAGVRIRAHGGNDELQFTVGAGFGSAGTLACLFDGGAGTNTAKIWGSTSTTLKDVASIYPMTGTVSGPGYSLSLAGMRGVTVDSQEGPDEAYIYDSSLANTLEAHPDWVTLSNGAYVNRAEDFRYVFVYAQVGGAYSAAGGYDVANLYGIDGVRDFFRASAMYGIMSDAETVRGTTYFVRANWFEEVHAYGLTANGKPSSADRDQAMLFDAPTIDVFEADATEALAIYRYTAASIVTAHKFRVVKAYGSPGDTADLYGPGTYNPTPNPVMYTADFTVWANGFVPLNWHPAGRFAEPSASHAAAVDAALPQLFDEAFDLPEARKKTGARAFDLALE